MTILLYNPAGIVQQNVVGVSVRDYGAIGDGVADDTAAFLAAFNSTTNLVVLIPSGTYRISAPILKTGGRITILAQPGAVIKPVDSYSAGSGDTRSFLKLIDAEEVVIDGLSVDGNRTALNAGLGFPDWTNFIYGIQCSTQGSTNTGRVIIRRCHVYNYPSIGISVDGHDDVVIEDNIVENGMFHGILVARTTGSLSSNAIISRNRIEGPGNFGTNPSIGGIGILAIQVNKVLIDNNRINNTSDTGSKTEGCDDVTYDRNIVTDSGKDGIKVQAAGPGAIDGGNFTITRMTITNNTVRRINAWRTDGSSLILLHDTTHAVIAGNLLEGGGTRIADAIRINNTTGASYSEFGDIIVDNNIVKGELTAGGGIRVVAPDGVISRAAARITISNNRLTAGLKVGFPAVGDWQVSNNVITSHIPGTLVAATYGIELGTLASGTAVIENNTIVDHTNGIIVSVDPGEAIDLIRIAKNSIRNINGFGYRVDCFATPIASCNVVEFESNQITRPTSGGATVTAPWRLGTANLTVNVFRVSGNVTVNNSPAGSYQTIGEITGSNNPIGVFVYNDDTFAGNEPLSGRFINGGVIGAAGNITRTIGSLPNQSGPPIAGTWRRGDLLINTVPTISGTFAWQCVVSGTPGTWRTLL